MDSVPAPELTPANDISIFFAPNNVARVGMSSCFKFPMLKLVNAGGLVCTSLQKTRSVKEILVLLKEIITPHDFRLQTLPDRQDVDLEGTICPGHYLVGMAGIFVSYVPLINFPCI